MQDYKKEGPYISFVNRHLFSTWSYLYKLHGFMEQDRYLPDEKDGTLKVFVKQDSIP